MAPSGAPHPECSCFFNFIVAKSQLTLSWPGTEALGLQQFLIGSEKGEVDVEKATFPEGEDGMGGVESTGPALALTAQGRHLTPRHPSLLSHSFGPRPGKASKASFLPPGSTSIQGRLIPGGHTMALISHGARRRDPAHTPSLTYFLFPPSGSGLAQSGHILMGAKKRASTTPSLSRLSLASGLTPPW